jgi:SAM-dependent methyltransferase
MNKISKDYNWLIYSVIDPPLKERIKKYARGRLLDIGCGEKPYDGVIAQCCVEHVGLDYEGTLHQGYVEIVGSALDLPVDDCSYDSILCTDVLEHLEEPSDAIAQAFRALRPGGIAIYTVPLYWHLHEEPHDFFRYTCFGLEYLFRKNGFEIVEIVPLGGLWVSFSQEMVYALQRLRWGGKWSPFWWMVWLIGHFLQGGGYLLNSLGSSERFATEYLLVARRPEGNV